MSLVVVGMSVGAQGPATIKLAEQAGFVVELEDGTLDTSHLNMIGLATSIDAFAGLFACFAAAYLSEKYKPWHIQHVISMLGTGVFFICAPPSLLLDPLLAPLLGPPLGHFSARPLAFPSPTSFLPLGISTS